jgi:hypothetical protein
MKLLARGARAVNDGQSACLMESQGLCMESSMNWNQCPRD